MRFFETAKESFRDLRVAVFNVCYTECKQARVMLLLALAGAGLLAALPYTQQGLFALLINEITSLAGTNQFTGDVQLILAAIIVFFLTRSGVQSLIRYLNRVFYNARQKRNEKRYTDTLAYLDTAVHEDKDFKGRLQVLQEYGSSRAVTAFLDVLMDNMGSIFGLGMAVSIVAVADWRLCLLILAASLPYLYVEFKFGKGMYQMFEDNSMSRRLYQNLRHLSLTPKGIREMHVSQTSTHILDKLHVMLSGFMDGQTREFRKRLFRQLGCAVLVAIAICITLITLIARVLDGSMQIGTFTFVMYAALALVDQASNVLGSLATLQVEAKTVTSYFDIMATPRHVSRPVEGVLVRKDRAPKIEFVGVSFAYPSKPEVMVLRNFNLTIESGERLAFVGVNGAGKTTLINLLCRFYDPVEGHILVDGVDLREVDLDSWHATLGILPQEFVTYHFTVAESIRMGRIEDKSFERIPLASARAEAAEFIEKYTKQYDEQIGLEFGGINPSGGQMQKLALARTFFRDAPITILDEPTAHVDAGAERLIFQRLEALEPTQTLILISHRFSTLRSADKICVLKDGEISELGTHDQLVATGGEYAELFENQAEGYR